VTGDIWLSEREQRAWRSYVGSQSLLKAALARELQRDSGLSEADFEMLVLLSEASGRRLRAFELGAAAGWEKSRLSHHLTRMEQRGLITREQCADSRYFDIVLTDHGLDVIQAAAPRHVAHVREWFVAALTPEQLDTLAEACDAVSAQVCPPADCRPCAEPPGCDEVP
jgi:DNA-binding MarR family transcriptional regulator